MLRIFLVKCEVGYVDRTRGVNFVGFLVLFSVIILSGI